MVPLLKNKTAKCLEVLLKWASSNEFLIAVSRRNKIPYDNVNTHFEMVKVTSEI